MSAIRRTAAQVRELSCRAAVVARDVPRLVFVRARVASMRLRDEAGQTVAEYALVLLVAAAIAGSLLIWAKQSGKLDQFFDAIFAKLLGSVDPGPSPTPGA